MRHIRFGAAIAALACACTVWLNSEPQHPYRSTAPVCIELSFKDDLSGPAFTTLRTETTRIWLRQGIALRWAQPPQEPCDRVIPIIFDEAKVRTLAGKKRDALAVTAFAGRSRTIYVSALRAFQMISQLHSQSSILETVGERDYRHGTLMGRVVAHELGHVLLETTAHSATGLMRPIFDANDAMSPDERTTDLSTTESQQLAMRFSLVPLDASPEPTVLAQGGR